MIVCIDFKKSLDDDGRQAVDEYLRSVDEGGLGEMLTHLRNAVMYILADMLEKGNLDLSPVLRDVVRNMDYCDLGRMGLRKLTSSWALREYPNATHEFLITFVDPDHDRVHVLLVYL